MTNENNEKVILEWKYTPPDFFEDHYQIENKNYQIDIDSGGLKATVTPSYYNAHENIILEIHEEINSHFLGAQTLNFKLFNLLKPTMHRLHPDGRKDITIFHASLNATATLGDFVDVVVTDKDGNIVEDSKVRRSESIRHFANLAATHRKSDSVAGAILNSFNAALNDLPNEFIHLYEIRESLCKEFGNEKEVRDVLKIPLNEIKRLRELSNSEPLNQGRHRGKNPGQLRDATQSEKEEARDIARKLIHHYLEFIDGVEALEVDYNLTTMGLKQKL